WPPARPGACADDRILHRRRARTGGGRCFAHRNDGQGAGMAGIAQYRSDFAALADTVNGKPFAYLDTASSAQKPAIVMESMRDLMEHYYANIHRGLYHHSQAATRAYENVRIKAAEFIN